MSAFQEYPKSLYRKGEHLIVQGKRAEKAARGDGWTDKEAPVVVEVLSDAYSRPDYSARPYKPFADLAEPKGGEE